MMFLQYDLQHAEMVNVLHISNEHIFEYNLVKINTDGNQIE